MKGTRDVLGGWDAHGQGPWHMGDARDILGQWWRIEKGQWQRIEKGWWRRIEKGWWQRIEKGQATLRRGGACRNVSGHIEGGRSACVRLWLGLGHMKGVWDASGMVAVHR